MPVPKKPQQHNKKTFLMTSHILVDEAAFHIEAARKLETSDGDPLSAASHYIRAVELVVHSVKDASFATEQEARQFEHTARQKLLHYTARAELLLRVARDEEASKRVPAAVPNPRGEGAKASAAAAATTGDHLPTLREDGIERFTATGDVRPSQEHCSTHPYQFADGDASAVPPAEDSFNSLLNKKF